jgi:hypothetical protein
MNTRKILKAALDGCDRAEVARSMEMTLGSLNNQVAGELPYAPKGKTPNFLDRTYNFIDMTSGTTGKHIVLQALAEEFGYMLIANPAIRVDETPAIAQISRILHEFSSVVDEIGRANGDGRIEPYEAEPIRNRWEILKRMIEEFVLACESGSFNKAD